MRTVRFLFVYRRSYGGGWVWQGFGNTPEHWRSFRNTRQCWQPKTTNQYYRQFELGQCKFQLAWRLFYVMVFSQDGVGLYLGQENRVRVLWGRVFKRNFSGFSLLLHFIWLYRDDAASKWVFNTKTLLIVPDTVRKCEFYSLMDVFT